MLRWEREDVVAFPIRYRCAEQPDRQSDAPKPGMGDVAPLRRAIRCDTLHSSASGRTSIRVNLH
jgi:hypothetical protein